MTKLKEEGWANVSGSTSVLTDINGQFELRKVVPGTNAVSVTMAMPGGRQVSARLDVPVGDKDISDLQLVLQPTPAITGRVIYEDGKPRPGLLRLMGESTTSYGTPVAANGTFNMSAIPPGVYRVSANFSESEFIRSARSGSRNVMTEGIDVTAGTPEPIEMVMASTAGSIAGTVTNDDGALAKGAVVAIIPLTDRRERPDLFKTAATDQFGRFTIRGIAPGNYKAFAWEDIEPYVFFDPAFLQRFEALGQSIVVNESESQTVNLKVIP
jgi:hypothetical protein